MAEMYITDNILGEDGLVPDKLKVAVLDGKLDQLMEAEQDAQPAIDEEAN